MDSTKTGSNETTARAPAPKLEGVKTGKPRGFAAMDRSRVSEIARIEIDICFPALEGRIERLLAPLRGEAEPAFRVVDLPMRRIGVRGQQHRHRERKQDFHLMGVLLPINGNMAANTSSRLTN